MLARDGRIGTFLLFVSILLCYGAIRLGIGETHNPGPGFFPFLAGLIIAVLSLVMIISSIKERPNRNLQKSPLVTTGSALILTVLLFFGFLVEKAGFFVCTFFATLLMLRANGVKRWSYLFFVAFLTCAAIFVVFNVLLEVRLPLGILEFRG